jgi:type VI secretion system protein VasJ
VAETAEQIRERARPYLEPVPGPAPAGVSSRLEPAFQAVADEVARLDAPAGGEIDWKRVVARSTELLKSRTKDIQLATYLAHGLHRTGGIDGLATGLAVVGELLDQYWESCFPEVKRLRARANAIQWLMEKTKILLDEASAAGRDLAATEALELSATRYAEVIRTRLGEAAPAMGPLLEAAARLHRSAEAASAPPPPPEAPPSAPATSTPAAASTTAASPLPAAPSAALAGAADATDFLRTLGTSLIEAGALLRRADASDPTAYRVLRTGLWLHMTSQPPAAGGRTTVPPPAGTLKDQLGLLAQNQKWAVLLEETESALPASRFWLDLHRLTAQALAGLGPSHERARAAVVSELRTLLARMPQLPTLAFASGEPLADPATRSWIEEEVAPAKAAGPGASAAEAPDEESAGRLAAARKLLAGGQVAEGLGALQQEVARGPAGRARFKARLALARACAGSSLLPLAKATYEELDLEAVRHGLDEWEPALAAECLKGLIATSRALAKDPRGASDTLTLRHQRLCRLDPAAAHEVWP